MEKITFKVEIDLEKLDTPEKAKLAMMNDIYRMCCAYFEQVGEHQNMIRGNGHHMAQNICDHAVKLWENNLISQTTQK